MEIITVLNGVLEDAQLDKAVKALSEGKVIMHATETCYGLAVDIHQPGALERLYSLKGMPSGKPVSVMVRNIEEARKYGVFNAMALQLVNQLWPGPLTVVVPSSQSLPDGFIGTVGLRCPDHALTQQLLAGFDGPLATTSANASGEPQMYMVDPYMKLQPDVVLDSGEIEHCAPSTVVQVLDDGWEVLREGEVVDTVRQLLKTCEK